MSTEFASLLVNAVLVYALIGVVFALAFVAKGVQKIDDSALEPPFGFRLLLIPGSAAFWPLLLRRWISRSQPPTETNAHRQAAKAADAGRTELR